MLIGCVVIRAFLFLTDITKIITQMFDLSRKNVYLCGIKLIIPY